MKHTKKITILHSNDLHGDFCMNALAPDIVTIGNHEIDYGIAHLLFIEKCTKFPIINANLYIKNTQTRLFTPYKIIRVDGMNILSSASSRRMSSTRPSRNLSSVPLWIPLLPLRRWARSAMHTTASTLTSPCCSPTSALRRTSVWPVSLTRSLKALVWT